MKIHIKRGKRGSISLRFVAQDKDEAVKLKDAILATHQKTGSFNPVVLLNQLESMGFTEEPPDEKPD